MVTKYLSVTRRLLITKRYIEGMVPLLINITGLRDIPTVIISGVLKIRELVSITTEKANIDPVILVK